MAVNLESFPSSQHLVPVWQPSFPCYMLCCHKEMPASLIKWNPVPPAGQQWTSPWGGGGVGTPVLCLLSAVPSTGALQSETLLFPSREPMAAWAWTQGSSLIFIKALRQMDFENIDKSLMGMNAWWSTHHYLIYFTQHFCSWFWAFCVLPFRFLSSHHFLLTAYFQISIVWHILSMLDMSWEWSDCLLLGSRIKIVWPREAEADVSICIYIHTWSTH